MPMTMMWWELEQQKKRHLANKNGGVPAIAQKEPAVRPGQGNVTTTTSPMAKIGGRSGAAVVAPRNPRNRSSSPPAPPRPQFQRHAGRPHHQMASSPSSVSPSLPASKVSSSSSSRNALRQVKGGDPLRHAPPGKTATAAVPPTASSAAERSLGTLSENTRGGTQDFGAARGRDGRRGGGRAHTVTTPAPSFGWVWDPASDVGLRGSSRSSSPSPSRLVFSLAGARQDLSGNGKGVRAGSSKEDDGPYGAAMITGAVKTENGKQETLTRSPIPPLAAIANIAPGRVAAAVVPNAAAVTRATWGTAAAASASASPPARSSAQPQNAAGHTWNAPHARTWDASSSSEESD